MVEKLIEVLSQVAGIGTFALVVAEKAAGLFKRRRSQREARERPKGPENK